MKKSLIALAVAGAMTAPLVAQADATLYGIAEVRAIDKDDTDFDLNMNKTRLGVKGTAELDNVDGVQGLYQFEWEFDANGGTDASLDSTVSGDVSVRKSLVGLKGNFGQVTFGRQNHPGAETHVTDTFKNASGYVNQSGDRVGNALSYATPNMNGAVGYVVLIADEGTNAGEDLDAFALGVNYRANGIYVGLAYTEVDGGTSSDEEITELGASYTMNDLTVGGYYGNTDDSSTDVDAFGLVVAYNMGNVVAKLGYEEKELTSTTDGEKTTGHIGYKLGSQAYAYIQYDSFNSEAEAAGDKDAISAGYSISF